GTPAQRVQPAAGAPPGWWPGDAHAAFFAASSRRRGISNGRGNDHRDGGLVYDGGDANGVFGVSDVTGVAGVISVGPDCDAIEERRAFGGTGASVSVVCDGDADADSGGTGDCDY